jgi:hypothetical protein
MWGFRIKADNLDGSALGLQSLPKALHLPLAKRPFVAKDKVKSGSLGDGKGFF